MPFKNPLLRRLHNGPKSPGSFDISILSFRKGSNQTGQAHQKEVIFFPNGHFNFYESHSGRFKRKKGSRRDPRLSLTHALLKGENMPLLLSFAIIARVPLKRTKDPTWTLGAPRRTSAALSSLASQVGKLLREMVPFWIANKFNLSTWLWGMDIGDCPPPSHSATGRDATKVASVIQILVSCKVKHHSKRSTCDKYFNSCQHFDEIYILPQSGT